MKEKYISHVLGTYKVGDLVFNPVTNTIGIIFEVKKTVDTKTVSAYGYRIQWQDPTLNKRPRYWDHYEICLVQSTT